MSETGRGRCQGDEARLALLIGAGAVAVALLIGGLGHAQIHRTLARQHHRFYLSEARHLADAASFHGAAGVEQAMVRVAQIWQEGEAHSPDAYLCVVDGRGRLLLHTARPEQVGRLVGKNRLLGREGTRPTTLGELVTLRESCVGEYVASDGQLQIAAFVPVKGRGWTLGVHRSQEALHGEVHADMERYIFGYLILCLLLFPLPLLLLYRSVSRSRHRQHEAEIELLRLQQDVEARRLQEQKMEAVGQLAGGIAHDFNNILSAILGNLDILEARGGRPAEERAILRNVTMAAERASELTEQLLGFARKGKNRVVPVELSRLAQHVKGLLERTFDRAVRIDLELHEGETSVVGDPAQLEQILLNLAVNARDAMGHGGCLTIRCRRIVLTEREGGDGHALDAGNYVELTVQDTGPGFRPEDFERAFEPFYTTKDAMGTGLGLSVAYGVARNHGGALRLANGPEGGAIVRVLLPAADECVPAPDPSLESPSRAPHPSRARILVVDDEEAVRKVARSILERLGHSVDVVASAAEALERLRAKPDGYDLVLLDLIMPDMDGRDCHRAMRERGAKLPVLLMSGYAPDGRVEEALVDGMAGFLQKPFRMESLSEAIRKVLGS